LTAPQQAATAPAKPKLPAVLSALAVVGICLFSHLGALGLVGPDEPRYVWIARAMAQTGDWVTPRLYGVPWFEKPVLYYWTAAIGFDLHLPAEWAARLPSAFAALAAALAVGWLGWKHYGPAQNHSDENAASTFVTSPAVLAPLIFCTSVAAIGFARAATPDMLFSASITLAMACGASCMAQAGALRACKNVLPDDGKLPLGTLALFGAFLGLGVLAKGPAAVILAGGAIGLWALATSRFRVALRLAHPMAIAAFCAVALPWYLLCARRNPDFLHVFIFQHNFERYLTPMFQHKQPFWFFGPIALVALLPWTPFLIATLPEGRRILSQNTWRTSPGFFFTCWALFPILFFSLSQSKLPSYILPAIPPLALVLAVSATYGFTRTRTLSLAISLSIAIVWLILEVVAAEYFLADPQSAVASKLILALAVLAALLSIVFGSGRNLKALVFTSAFAAAIAVEIAGFSLLPNLDSSVSAREIATSVSASPQTDFYTYRLQRSWNYGLAFYAGREIKEWSPEDPDAASLLTTAQGLNELKKLGRFSGSVNPAERGVRYVRIEAARR
jgi:4-amino-4-deoxy-L-arabinose transferase-like glycosyltransferase